MAGIRIGEIPHKRRVAFPLILVLSMLMPALAGASAKDESPSSCSVQVVDIRSANSDGVREHLVNDIWMERSGDAIKVGSVAVQLPSPGQAVTANLNTTEGGEELTVGVDEAGTASVRFCSVSISEVSTTGEDDSAKTSRASKPRKGSRAPSFYAALPKCTNTNYSALPYKWNQRFDWRFKSDTTPSGLAPVNVETALREGTNSIPIARNSCGRPDYIEAGALYLGTTTLWSNISFSGGAYQCLSPNGVNSTDFAGGPANVLAVACTWYSGNNASESDARFNKQSHGWVPSSANPNCGGRYNIRAVTTHERGHTFGLADLYADVNANLAMYYASSPCNEAPFRLGLGDMLGFESKY